MATNAVTLWPGIELETDRRGEWVESDIPVADPAWTLIDSNGHGHFYADGFPTLRWVSLPCTMGHGEDCGAEGYYECAICAEHIRPATRTPEPVYIGGPTEYQLIVRHGETTTTYKFGGDKWDAVQDAVFAAIATTLADNMHSIQRSGGVHA